MKKITIKIDDDFFEKINARSNKTGCKTISQCARELMDLGLKAEEAAASYPEKKNESELNPLLLNMLKTIMSWSLETRFISRFLTEKNSEIGEEKALDFLKQAKERAAEYADGFVTDAQKT